MIEFEIKPGYYKQIHNALFAVDDECRMEFSKTGVSIALVDPANVLIGIVNIPKKAFESFKIDKTVSIGYALKLFETDAEQTMFLGSKVNHKFQIQQEDGLTDITPITQAVIEHDIFTEKTTLPDAESIRKKPRPPQLDLPCVFGLDVSILKKLVKRGEYVRFDTNIGRLVCYGTPNWCTSPITIASPDCANSMFSNDYLKDITKAIPRNVKSVKMTMGIDYPCTIEFKICDGQVLVKYLLAPRIESD